VQDEFRSFVSKIMGDIKRLKQNAASTTSDDMHYQSPKNNDSEELKHQMIELESNVKEYLCNQS